MECSHCFTLSLSFRTCSVCHEHFCSGCEKMDVEENPCSDGVGHRYLSEGEKLLPKGIPKGLPLPKQLPPPPPPMNFPPLSPPTKFAPPPPPMTLPSSFSSSKLPSTSPSPRIPSSSSSPRFPSSSSSPKLPSTSPSPRFPSSSSSPKLPSSSSMKFPSSSPSPKFPSSSSAIFPSSPSTLSRSCREEEEEGPTLKIKGWLRYCRSRTGKKSKLKKYQLIWCELDELNEYLLLFTGDPTAETSRSLASVPLEKAHIEFLPLLVIITRGVKKELPLLKICLPKGKCYSFLPASEEESDIYHMILWKEAALKVRSAAVSAQELLDQWKKDPVCKMCVGGIDLDDDENELPDELTTMSDYSYASEMHAEPRSGPSNGGEEQQPQSQNQSLEFLNCLVETLDGEKIRLGNAIASRDGASPTVLLLLRHFGCVLCRALIGWWAKAMPVINALGATVVAVGVGSAQTAKVFVEEYNFKGTLLIDQRKMVYQELRCRTGIKYAFSSDVMDLSRQTMASGYTQDSSMNKNALQLGGAFLISRSHGIIFEHQERHAGETLQKIGDLIRALILHQYYEPRDSFPGNFGPPTWKSMLSRNPPFILDNCGPLLFFQNAFEKGYHLETGVINPLDTSSPNPFEDNEDSSAMRSFLQKSVIQQENTKSISRSIHNLASQGLGKQKKERKVDWRNSVEEVLDSMYCTFPLSPLLLPIGTIATFHEHFFLFRGEDPNRWDDVFVWLFAPDETPEGSFDQQSMPKKELGGWGVRGLAVVVAKICSTNDAKVLVFSSLGIDRLLIPRWQFFRQSNDGFSESSNSLKKVLSSAKRIKKESIDTISRRDRRASIGNKMTTIEPRSRKMIVTSPNLSRKQSLKIPRLRTSSTVVTSGVPLSPKFSRPQTLNYASPPPVASYDSHLSEFLKDEKDIPLNPLSNLSDSAPLRVICQQGGAKGFLCQLDSGSQQFSVPAAEPEQPTQFSDFREPPFPEEKSFTSGTKLLRKSLKNSILHRFGLQEDSLRTRIVSKDEVMPLMIKLNEFETEKIVLPKKLKIGVLYRKRGQSEMEMYANEPTSDSFKAFLSILGKKTLRANCKYQGGLDAGDHLLRTCFEDYNIVWHVAPWIPLSADGVLPRKRHVGNDTCVVIFDDVILDEGGSQEESKDSERSMSFDATKVASHFNHVFAVVRPLQLPRMNGKRESRKREKYEKQIRNDGEKWEEDEEVCDIGLQNQYQWALNVVSKPEVPPFPPALPPRPVFDASSLRDVLLTKLINGDRTASEYAGTFRKQRVRMRSKLIQDIISSSSSSSSS